MSLNKVLSRIVLVSIAAVGMLTLAGCGERKPADKTSSPPASTAPAAPPIAPGTAVDADKKGTSTGMIGGEAGTVSSSGKPGSGTESGAGTGAAQASGSKTSDKK